MIRLPFIKSDNDIPWPHFKRGAEREMTLIAGLTGFGGVILCADSQETVGNYHKKSVSKIQHAGGKEFSFACAGAGHGPYIDMVTQELTWEVEKLRDSDLGPSETQTLIQRIIVDYYQQHVWPRKSPNENLDIELLAVTTGGMGGPFLFHTCETAVNWIQDRKCIGVGGYLADYLCDHLHTRHGDQYHMLAVAAYILKKARDYIEGCGKESEIYMFPSGHNSPTVSLFSEELSQLEAILEDFDKAAKDIFLAVTDIRETWPPNVNEARNAFLAVEAKMKHFVREREENEGKIRRWLSMSRKSEGQQ